MIIQEKVTIGNQDLLYTYSDIGNFILQVETGIMYDAAYDVIPCKYTYTETEIKKEDENI